MRIIYSISIDLKMRIFINKNNYALESQDKNFNPDIQKEIAPLK